MDQNQVTVARAGEENLAQLASDAASRKKFLRMAGGAGVAGVLGAFLSACGETTTTSPSTAPAPPTSESTETEAAPTASKGDLEILNYALTLEFLEAKFYKDVIDSGVIEDKALAKVAVTFGDEEAEHVAVLTDTINSLGGKPAKDPGGDFKAVIKEGAEAVLMAAATVENLGAAAYLGQAARIKSPEVLAAALSIHTVEARHAAALNTAAGLGFAGSSPLEGSIPDGPFAVPMDMQAVLKAVAPYLPKKG